MRAAPRVLAARGKHFSRRKLGTLTAAAVAVFLLLLVVLVFYGDSNSDNLGDLRPATEEGLQTRFRPSFPAGGRAELSAGVIDIAEVPVNPFVKGGAAADKTSYNAIVRDANGDESVITHAISGGVEMQFPLITFRDRLGAPKGHGPQDWRSRAMPNQAYHLPMWASAKEKNTLRHASIFISIAAFRDFECATTLESALANAASPHRIYFGISEERRLSDVNCLSRLQLDTGTDVEAGEGPQERAEDEKMADVIGTDHEGADAVARKLLYGADAPSGIVIRKRALRWADILIDPHTKQPNNASIAAARSAYGTPGDTSATNAVPPGIYMEDSFMEKDLITCVYSDLEVERDRLTLDPAAALESVVATRTRKGPRGGPQEHPAEALRGCRVTTRVTPEVSARGPTFGRYVTSLFFFHQDYYMVIDSHSRLAPDWDMKMIARVFQMNTRGVLSHYPNGYTVEQPLKEYGQDSTMSMCKAVILDNGMPKLGARWIPMTDAPVIEGLAAAGYIYGDAQYILDTPFDPFLPYLFDGEEILYSARMWTRGWDIYAPGQPNVFHHYGRKNTPKFWSLVRHEETRQRMISERRALFLLERAHPWLEVLIRRGVNTSAPTEVPYVPPENRTIVDKTQADATAGVGIERVYYGMGSVRTLAQYWDFTQLTDRYIKKKDNENRWEGGDGLCDAVGPE